MKFTSLVPRVFSRGVGTLSLLVLGTGMAMAQFPSQRSLTVQHPAVGSWFGQAVQLCATLKDPSCYQVTLFMTPTLLSDGGFVAGDTLELGGPPFGPHTTAHGQWIATSPTDLIADYVFILNGSTTGTMSVLRFRWLASAIAEDTMTGYVNAIFGPDVPLVWQNITPSQSPTLPSQATPALTPPVLFYTDPAQCPGGPPACPLIFKFTIKRVAP